ncbi:MAG: hypothetical protein LQ340_005039 [Diploschistes diacapsis]|nr:MAG: hypothetical protein LQ340_005039 [Diploschistes diacapsis]
MADAISIEETNKVRALLGYTPLPVPGAGPSFKNSNSSDSEEEEEEQGSTLESRQAEGYDNWQRIQDEETAKKERQARIERVKKARDEAQRFAKLEGKGLGEADDDGELDTKEWLLKRKKRQRKVEKERERARKMEQELREREEAEYTSKDLTGLRVAHEAGDFEMEGGEQVLTLKDATIDENEEEGDELENAGLVEKEKRDERLNLKRKKPGYNPAQLGDETEGAVLQQYDEVIDGKKRKRFVLDGEAYSTEKQGDASNSAPKEPKRQAINLDILKDLPKSDYQEPKEVKIKKSKSKKSKPTRQKVVEEDDIFPAAIANGAGANRDFMNIDSGTKPSEPKMKQATSFVDDEDLQASLAKQRREALKKRKKLKPEDLARQIREEASATPEVKMEDGLAEDEGLLIDETSEFVANLQRPEPAKPRTIVTAKPRESLQPSVESPAAEEDEDVDIDKSYNEVVEAEEAAARIKREESTPGAAGMTETGLESEITTTGMASTINLLTQRGLIKPKNNDDSDKVQGYRDGHRFKAEIQKRQKEADARARTQRERDRASGKLDRMSAREREEYARWENKQRDQAESRQMTEIFNREYKPDVQLNYIDDYGRHMNPKEAFKHLSHQFHGKGSGKQKTEKLIKKIDEEKKREAASVLDSSSGAGMNNAQSATMKKNKQAGVRLA